MTNFHSPGKLLITGEYAVLDGAKAFAIPTKLGQEMIVEDLDSHNFTIFWNAFHQGKRWFSAEINYRTWEILKTDNVDSANFILKVFKNLNELNSEKFAGKDFQFKTNLEFPANFGLGSSSTLMANLAKWGNADAFILNEKSLGGSGYDIAVAIHGKSILYNSFENKKSIEIIDFKPNFLDEIIFIHLNQKQDSREGIRLYKEKTKSQEFLNKISEISESAIHSQNLAEFSALMEKHETLISEFLGLEKVKEKYFADCPVFVKSLGAWGGDFVMSAKFGNYEEYFKARNFNTIFSYKDLII